MRKFSKLIKSCSPVIQMIRFLTWDVFKFLFGDTVSLVAIFISQPDGNC